MVFSDASADHGIFVCVDDVALDDALCNQLDPGNGERPSAVAARNDNRTGDRGKARCPYAQAGRARGELMERKRSSCVGAHSPHAQVCVQRHLRPCDGFATPSRYDLTCCALGRCEHDPQRLAASLESDHTGRMARRAYLDAKR